MQLKRILKAGLLGIVVIVVSVWVGKSFLNKYIFADVGPVQPINFSHRIHTGVNKIPCLYCHIYATRSKVSGAPSVERCMGCHSSIRKDSSEVKKLYGYWQKKQPIKWVKIHDLPDYIYFSHKRHVTKGVDCRECHGDVASMDRVKKVSDVQMGWCLYCHTERNGPTTDCWECHI